MHVSWIDIGIVVIYIGAAIFAGTIARGAIKGISDFLVAGRSLRIHTASATYISTGLGLVTVMYFAEEGFKNGFAPFFVGLISLVGAMVIARTGFIVSRLRHLRVMTVPEFYELRYQQALKTLTAVRAGLQSIYNRYVHF